MCGQEEVLGNLHQQKDENTGEEYWFVSKWKFLGVLGS